MKLSFFKSKKSPVCTAVILAAGSSTRADSDKLFTCLSGAPVLAYTISAFQKSDKIRDIIVVTRDDKIDCVKDICSRYSFTKVTGIIAGGDSRTESALKGVEAVSKKAELIAVHDGARPFVSDELISACVKAARKYHSAVPSVPSVDSVKLTDKSKYYVGALDRNCVARIQTPQVFDADLIKGALTAAVSGNLNFTDDSSAVEHMGFKAAVVRGSEDNIKITYKRDFSLAEIILKEGNYVI